MAFSFHLQIGRWRIGQKAPPKPTPPHNVLIVCRDQRAAQEVRRQLAPLGGARIHVTGPGRAESFRCRFYDLIIVQDDVDLERTMTTQGPLLPILRSRQAAYLQSAMVRL